VIRHGRLCEYIPKRLIKLVGVLMVVVFHKFTHFHPFYAHCSISI